MSENLNRPLLMTGRFTYSLINVVKCNAITLCFVITLIYGCDHGLAPAEIKTDPGNSGLSGTITYQNWPPPDSINNLKVIVFKHYPPDNIFEEVTSGRAIVYPEELSESLPQFVDSTQFTLSVEPGVYEYVVVAQQFGGLFDWRAVGQFDETPEDSLPTPVTVLANSVLQNIDIHVDFNKLPVQPF
jgi:hypothetical protein